MKKIEVDGSGRLNVPDTVEIPFIEGDGVGAEITPVMQSVVDAAVGKAYGGRRQIEWKEVLAGEKAHKITAVGCRRRRCRLSETIGSASKGR